MQQTHSYTLGTDTPVLSPDAHTDLPQHPCFVQYRQTYTTCNGENSFTEGF